MVRVTQLEGEPEVTTEIIAQSIVRIDEAMKKILNSGLKLETLVLLLHDASGVNKTQCAAVLHSIAGLRLMYTTK